MGAKDIVDHLAKVPLFRELTRPQLHKVAKVTDVVQVKPGTVLMKERTYRSGSGPAFFLIGTGVAEVTKGKKRDALLKSGDSFGEMSLLDGKPRTATVTAKTNMTLYRIMSWHFIKLLRSEPTVSLGLLKAAAARLRKLDEKAR